MVHSSLVEVARLEAIMSKIYQNNKLAIARKTKIKRRSFLKKAGLVSVLVGGGLVWRAFDRGVFSVGEGIAYEPWDDWQTYEGKDPLALLSAAILAANPHNTQPWLFQVSDSRIDLYADTKRQIGSTDPFLREMYIGLGCALENLLLAADAKGFDRKLTLMPDQSKPIHVARIDLSSGKPLNSALYKAIPLRHTNRGIYDQDRSLDQETLQALEQLGNNRSQVKVFWFTTEAQRRQVGNAIIEATQAIIGDREQSQDSGKWMRLSRQDIQKYRDGLTLDASGSPALIRAIAKMLPPTSLEQNDRFWLDATRKVHVPTAAAFGILAVSDWLRQREAHRSDRYQQLKCGQLWQRMHLWATTQGLAMQPLNQMPERAAREEVLGIEPKFSNALAEFIGDPNWQALMMFRIGYPTTEALPSPRRSVKDVIRI
jgi:nitroreductase